MNDENKKKEGEDDGDDREEAAVVWNQDVDNLLITVCYELCFDFEKISVELGKRLNRRGPVNARLCRMRYAALDKYNLSGKEKKLQSNSTRMSATREPPIIPNITGTKTNVPPIVPSAPSAPSAPSKIPKINETVLLELPPDSLLNALAASYKQDSKNSSDDDNNSIHSKDEPHREGTSELAEVLAFLDSEEANTMIPDSASFHELFGIPESQLDRSQAFDVTSESDIQKKSEENEFLDLPDGNFDLTKFKNTFDRVAKAIGAIED